MLSVRIQTNCQEPGLSMKSRMILSALLVAGISTFASGDAAVHVRGSETMKAFGERLTGWYQQKTPSVHFDVSGENPAEAFAAMAAGKAEIVESSRRVMHSEVVALREGQDKNYVELQVATEVAGIAVDATNPVKEISLYDLRQVLSGNTRNWQQLGGNDAPIRIYGRDNTSGVGAFIEEEFMGDQTISPSVQTFPTNARMFEALRKDPNGIGFGTVETTLAPGVKFLAIKASSMGAPVTPGEDTIRSKSYKLIRPLYFYFAGAPSGIVRQFAQWVLSPQGQLVVESEGYYPLSSAEREEGMRILVAEGTNRAFDVPAF